MVLEQSYIDFLKNKRIELNTIINEIGAQRFWNWLRDKLIEAFPTRDYNRAIAVPQYLITPTMQKFEEQLVRYLTAILRPKVDEIEQDLSYTDGLLGTADKTREIVQDLLLDLLANPRVKKIDSALLKVMKIF